MSSVQCSVFGALYNLNGHEREAQLSEDDIARQAIAFYTTVFFPEIWKSPQKDGKTNPKKIMGQYFF